MAKKALKENPPEPSSQSDPSKRPPTRTLPAYKKNTQFESQKPILLNIGLTLVGLFLILLVLHFIGLTNLLYKEILPFLKN